MNLKKILIITFLFLGLLLIKKEAVFAQANSAPQSFLYLTWECDGMVPADYRAKALPARYAIIKTSVQPLIYSNGAYLNSDNWLYQWYVNDTLVNSGEGLKENRFIAEDPTKTSYTVKVKVSTSLSATPIEKSITINLVNPFVFFKPSNEKNIVIDNYNTEGKLVNLEAVPFFFGNYGSTKLHYMWTIGNQRMTQLDNKTNITVFHLEDNPETIPVRLVIEDLRDVIIRAQRTININFTK